MSKKDLRFKGKMEIGRVIAYLEDLIKSLREGTLYVQQGEEYVALHPVELMKLEVEAGRKDEKERLMFEISWKKEATIPSQSELKITPSEPEKESKNTGDNAYGENDIIQF